MNHIEGPYVVFRRIQVMDERAAHVIDFFDKVRVECKRATVVVNAMDAFIQKLVVAHAREDVNLMAFSLHGGRQFCNMNGDTAHRDRM